MSALSKLSLSLSKLVSLEVSYSEVVLAVCAVVLLDSLLVKSNLLSSLLNESSGTEKCSLVKNVDVLLDELEELLASVVLVLYVSDESCTTKLRKNLLSESCVNCRHVLDLLLADSWVAVHRKNADDEILVLEVRSSNELLESFPVLTYACYVNRSVSRVLLCNYCECLLSRL